MFGAGWLMEQKFPPLEYVVPGIIPAGMTLLVAAPKIGKSWMVLGLGIAVSSGAPAFGAIDVGRPRPVLYCALEDGARRLQARLIELGAEGLTDTLSFITDIAKGDVIATLTEFVEMWRDHAPVVILDTLGKAMPPAAAGESDYQRDYRVGGALKAIADSAPGASVLIVHHTRKQAGEDFVDSVSGTQGLAGAADTILLLRRERHEKRATLQVTSRDAAEGEYSLTLNGAGKWELDGASLEASAAAARDAKQTQGVGDRMAEVIEKVGAFPEGIKPHDVGVLLGMDDKTAQVYLSRAYEAGRVDRPKRGTYTPIPPVGSVGSVGFPSGPNQHPNTTNTPLRLVGTES
jgi:hypothetical protein